MKKFFDIILGEEFGELETYTPKQKAVLVYFIISFCLLLLSLCSCNVVPILLACGNMVAALHVGKRNLSGFDN